MDKSAKVLMAETVALASDRMFAEIRYKSLHMETYMVKQIISPPIKLFNLAEIFICKQRSNKILTCYGRRNDTFFRESTINRCYNYVYPVFIPCNRCFDWSGLYVFFCKDLMVNVENSAVRARKRFRRHVTFHGMGSWYWEIP